LTYSYYDDDSIQENVIITEMYNVMLTIYHAINQVKLNVRPKSADVSLTAASHGCVGELQTQENEKSYSLVYKQSECPPPVPEKSTELQQYPTVKIRAVVEAQDQ
jgi:hypothetical protein